MELTDLINHPEQMDRDSLYELRSMVAMYPYFQTARILLLRNLYLLHDATFDEELRRSAIYITDRRVLFDMVEAAHYKIEPTKGDAGAGRESAQTDGSRTMSLIDNFLSTIPADDSPKKKKRKPTPADAAVDYVAYLLESEGPDYEEEPQEAPEMKGQKLIDNFIEKEGGRIVLKEPEEPTTEPAEEEPPTADKAPEEGFFTETLARIYIKQGRYSKALEIIKRLSDSFPKKNAYFADQIRFLEKLIINNNNKQ